jgi:hypothetical protein
MRFDINLHSFEVDDSFIVISLKGDSNDAVLHYSGDLDTLTELLGTAMEAVKESFEIVTN